MRSIRGSLVNLQPLIPVSIGKFDASLHERVSVQALIDTGATRTCITTTLIDQLGLEPRGKMLVAGATSYPERRRAYGYSIGFYCDDEAAQQQTLYVLPHEFIAPSFQENGNFQVLLGMDILSRGSLSFQRGAFEFAFDF